MRKDTIIHRPMSEYAFGLDEDTTVFRLRCASGGIAACTLWYGDTLCDTPVPSPALMSLAARERTVAGGGAAEWRITDLLL
ncbi:MAG: alpha amylase N-terminal ig-like domain-containing protein [Oscillospiraceae bacterium]